MMKQYPETHISPAVFEQTDKGSYGVSFPDLPGCITLGSTLQEAHKMAREALSLHLYGMECDGDDIPTPSLLNPVKALDSLKYGCYRYAPNWTTEP